MTTVAIRHGWRTRVREATAAVVSFAAGVVGATAGAPLLARLVGAAVFALGIYWLLDAVVFARTWRLTANSLEIPTLASRRREIVGGDDLAVSAAGRWVGTITVAGARGTRYLTVNPLISATDLRVWFSRIADFDGAV